MSKMIFELSGGLQDQFDIVCDIECCSKSDLLRRCVRLYLAHNYPRKDFLRLLEKHEAYLDRCKEIIDKTDDLQEAIERMRAAEDEPWHKMIVDQPEGETQDEED